MGLLLTEKPFSTIRTYLMDPFFKSSPGRRPFTDLFWDEDSILLFSSLKLCNRSAIRRRRFTSLYWIEYLLQIDGSSFIQVLCRLGSLKRKTFYKSYIGV